MVYIAVVLSTVYRMVMSSDTCTADYDSRPRDEHMFTLMGTVIVRISFVVSTVGRRTWPRVDCTGCTR